MAIRVVVADDEPLIREGIATVLRSAGDIDVVSLAADGRAAVEEALRHRVDVALLDIKMPVLDGLSALEELKRVKGPEVVMLTSFGDEPNVMRAVSAGACGFVLKNCTPDELIRAVRAAHDGDAYLSPAVTRMLLGMVKAPQDAKRRKEAGRRLATLSDREADVLRLVAEGLSNADVARRLRMSEATIKTYVSRILTKLDCANRVQAALLVRDAAW